MNDHRMYLAGLFVVPPLAALAALRLPVRRALPLLLAILSLLGGLTALRNRTWQDPARLWADSAAKSPSLYRPWSNLCGALTAAKEFNRALPACDAALSRNPPGPVPLINRAIAAMQLGMKADAGRDFAAAAQRWPENAMAHFNYGAFLFTAGDNQAALAEISRALERDRFLAPAYLLRARLAIKMARPAEARADLDLLLRLYPDNEEARKLLGQIR
jgi:tetratricopeptide (TPR) repeat protein